MSINLKKLSNKRTLIYGWVGAFCEDFPEKSFSEVTTAGGWWLPFRGVSSVWPPEECSTLPQQENFLFNKDISLFFHSFIQRWLNSIIHICSQTTVKESCTKADSNHISRDISFSDGREHKLMGVISGMSRQFGLKSHFTHTDEEGQPYLKSLLKLRFEVLYHQLIITSSSFR